MTIPELRAKLETAVFQAIDASEAARLIIVGAAMVNLWLVWAGVPSVEYLKLLVWVAMAGLLSFLLLTSGGPVVGVLVLALAGMNPWARTFLTTGTWAPGMAVLAVTFGFGSVGAWLIGRVTLPVAGRRPWLVPVIGCVALSACGTTVALQDRGVPASSGPLVAAPSLDALVGPNMTAEQWLNLSLLAYKQGRFLECIAAAQTAIRLKPDYAPAWNNAAAAYSSLHLYNLAVSSAQEAVRIDPASTLARNNLNWAMEQQRVAAKQ